MGGIDPAFRIKRATLAVAVEHLDAMEHFYGRQLGLPHVRRGATHLRLTAGASELRFSVVPPPGDPFYHFALLVPGNRFDAAHRWLAERVPLLTLPGSGDTVFHFDFWDARACYANDPASNILELIAHRGVEESPATTRDFAASELRGLSEVGIVASDLPGTVERLRAATLELWSGKVGDSGTTLGFFGRKAHTLILTSPGRPWLPTQRPGEHHPLEVVLGAENTADVVVRVGDTAPFGQGE